MLARPVAHGLGEAGFVVGEGGLVQRVPPEGLLPVGEGGDGDESLKHALLDPSVGGIGEHIVGAITRTSSGRCTRAGIPPTRRCGGDGGGRIGTGTGTGNSLLRLGLALSLCLTCLNLSLGCCCRCYFSRFHRHGGSGGGGRSRPNEEARDGIVDVHPIGNVLQAEGLGRALHLLGPALLEGPGRLRVGLAAHDLVAEQDHLGHGVVEVVAPVHLVQPGTGQVPLALGHVAEGVFGLLQRLPGEALGGHPVMRMDLHDALHLDVTLGLAVGTAAGAAASASASWHCWEVSLVYAAHQQCTKSVGRVKLCPEAETSAEAKDTKLEFRYQARSNVRPP